MADVHRAYDIKDDAYYVKVQGDAGNLYKYAGVNGGKDSYSKMRQLIAIEQKKDPMSKMIDHASPT